MIEELKDVDIESFAGKHNFLAEEVLIPNVDKCDSSRVNMFCSHLQQALVLKNPEFPRVFTNFENQVGKYSSAYNKSDRNWTVIKKIVKNEMNYAIVVQDEDGFIDILFRQPAERITEYYGYAMNNEVIDSKNEGSVIQKDEVVTRNTAYDKDLNFRFGSNLKAVYMSFNNMTYEDAIVISESAAKKFNSYSVEEITVNVNTNDILINLYGDRDNFKTFPEIGEDVVNKTLTSRRRINYDSALYDLTTNNLCKVNQNTDTIFYSEGKLVDIEIFSNADNDRLEKYTYNQQIAKYLKQSKDFYKEIYETLKEYVEDEDNSNYSADVSYWYKRAKDINDPKVKWKDNGSDFDNLIIKFKILKEQPLVIGCKLTNRYGGKGVLSEINNTERLEDIEIGEIRKDHEMPMTKDGQRADIILNALGVINRLNPAQLIEQELNFISDYIVRNLRDLSTLAEREEYFFDYINEVNPTQCESMVNYYNQLDMVGREKFFEDVFEEGIFIHQPPFYGNVKLDDMKRIYRKYPDCQPYEFEGIEEPLIMGDIYFMLLKHHPKTKFTSRSTSYVNLKNIPSKSTKYKHNQMLYQKTPIRVGEMELTNFFITNNIGEVMRMMQMYSINQEDRQKAVNTLLTSNIFNLEKIDLTGSESRTKTIFNTFTNCLGFEAVKNDKEENN